MVAAVSDPSLAPDVTIGGTVTSGSVDWSTSVHTDGVRWFKFGSPGDGPFYLHLWSSDAVVTGHDTNLTLCYFSDPANPYTDIIYGPVVFIDPLISRPHVNTTTFGDHHWYLNNAGGGRAIYFQIADYFSAGDAGASGTINWELVPLPTDFALKISDGISDQEGQGVINFPGTAVYGTGTILDFHDGTTSARYGVLLEGGNFLLQVSSYDILRNQPQPKVCSLSLINQVTLDVLHAVTTDNVLSRSFARGTSSGRVVLSVTDPAGTLRPPNLTSRTDIHSVYLGINLPLAMPVLSFIDTTAVSLNGAARQLPDGATTSDDPIVLSMRFDGVLELLPPPLVISDIEALQRRVVPNVVVSLPEPAIVNGRPIVPKYWGKMDSSTTATEGPAHIHAIADPDPKWNPATSGWYVPEVVPAAGAGDARWSVNSLPDPSAYRSGYYWLGEPSTADGTQGIAPAARQWGPDASTPGAPSWRSIYPYKPSVRNHVYYGPSGNIATITKGVRCNLHFVEHMWMDWGRAVRMPFTWVMVGIIMDFPTAGYQHYLLDSGRDPRSVGYPAINEFNVPYDSRINDGLDYRNTLAVNINTQTIGSELTPTAGHRVTTPFNMVAKPRMFFGVFNGANSYAGNYSGDGKHVSKGKLATGKDHRFYTLGRQHGFIGINHASHLVVFEMRFWHSALTLAQLDSQYGQLASTWKFNQYR